MKKSLIYAVLAFVVCGLTSVGVRAETIKVAVIEILSGPFAAQGAWIAHHAQAAFDEINARGGVLGGTKIEMVLVDNKGNPQDALLALKQVTGQGIRFIFGGTSSNIALALSDATKKHSEREPDNSALFLDLNAAAPELTNEKCNFWHFRFLANVDMLLEILTRQVATQKDLHKVYLINEDYSYGQAVQRAATDMLTRRRPDLQIVGNELHPLGKVKDFAPYVAKIKASGAEAVITGNWGNDLALLVKASKDSGLAVPFYTVTAHYIGTPNAFGMTGADRVLNISSWHPNVADSRLESTYVAFKRKYKEEWNMLPIRYGVEMWAKAIDVAGTADPIKVAKALEGMHHDVGAGPAWMRAEDHQLMSPQYAYLFTRAGGAVKHEIEGSGLGTQTVARFEAEETVRPYSCKMQRP